jgi:Galactosyltransferase
VSIIYTFVAGFDDASLPTELLPSDDDSIKSVVNRSAYYEHVQSHPQDSDITILNIKENMNEGKSQTWFKYASQIVEQYDFDYAIKADTDTYVVMDLFFDFANQHLPVRGSRIFAGFLNDAAYWLGTRPNPYGNDEPSTQQFLSSRSSMVHLYMLGQFYILSKDLAKWVSSKTFVNEKWYQKIEDYDMRMRVFDFPEQIHLVRIQPHQVFWVHPAKTRLRWFLFMNRISRRKNGTIIFKEPAVLNPRQRQALDVFDRAISASC